MRTTLAGTPATVAWAGTDFSTTEPGGNPGMFANLDVAEDGGTGADHHTLADLGMAIAGFLAAAAEGDVMEHRDVVPDLGRFTDDEAGCMIEEDAMAEFGAGMNVGLEHLGRAALQIQGEITLPMVPQPVVQTVRLDRVEALEIQERLNQPIAGRVAFQHGGDVGFRRFHDAAVIRGRFAERLHDQRQGNDVVLQPDGDAVEDRSLEAWLVEN